MYQLYKKIVISETGKTVGTGWLPPLPDLRDYSTQHPRIEYMAEKLGLSLKKKDDSLPSKADLRQWCSEITDQGNLGSCTAHAGMGIVEYFQQRAFDKHIDGSRLFLYKTTRNLMGITGDTGAYLRSTMGALVLCGVPAENYWPYTDGKDFDNDPPAFVYSIADNFEAIKYFCHDPMGQNFQPKNVLASVKQWIATGIPSMFGFYVFPSFQSSNIKGAIPYPSPGEQAEGGHAVVAVGYDDDFKITNTKSNKQTTGALLIRNSWGKDWGDNGYGWLPYDYILNDLASDFWSLISLNWIDTNQFGL